ncbi:MAG: winged helix-turn-helix domain-containing protein [Candidatus Nitrosotenuis sp.]|nr:winged helix-turn-helix domain-containing protein [Candidatus Nitrosotenuis sp.]
MTKQNNHKNDSDESVSNLTQNSLESNSDEFLKIVSLNDHNLKELGESLSNQNSREIIQLLLDSEMTAKQISEKTGISLSHTIYHLDKLQKAGIVIVTKTDKNEKGHDMKYYSSKFSLVIVPHQIYEKTYKSKSLRNIFNRIYKFVAIGIAALTSWLVTIPSKKIISSVTETGEEQTQVIETGDITTTVSVTLGIIILGLIAERVSILLKK